MATVNGKRNILSLNIEELKQLVSDLGEASFRAKQIFSWISKGVTSYDDMTNVPAKLREELDKSFYLGLPNIINRQVSKDGTIKVLFEMADGVRVESVLMRYSYGNSICISSQAGCRMGCTFCATAIGGLERNLSSGEMLGEVLAMKNLIGERINHIVVMGMGEPFDNYDNLAGFLKLINDKDGYSLSMRDITVSTCGIVPMIERFGDEFKQVNLAISLHAPNDEIRCKTMPIAKAYKYDELISACRKYTEKTGRRITFEYALINGVNDTLDCADQLSKHMKGWLTHINLIPLNEVKDNSYSASSQDNIEAFKARLEAANVTVTVRRTLGTDINAACGQLRNSSR